MQSRLLSLWHFFADALPRQTEKFWICLSILLPKFLAMKTVVVPKQGELPYYRLQIIYSDWVFSVRISSTCWFKHFISSRWDCLIIMNIIAEGEPLLKIRGRRLLNDLLIKSLFSISISSSSFGFEWEWVRVNEIWVRVSGLKIHNS